MPYNIYGKDDDEDQARKDALYDALLTAPAPDAVSAPDVLTQYASEPPTLESPALMDRPYAGAPSPTADFDAATAYGDALEQNRRNAMSDYVSAAATAPPPQSTGAKVGEFLGDNAVGLLGSFIDLAANKGRNIPQILTANAAAADQSRQARRAAEDQAMDFQLRAQAQRAAAAKGADAAERDQAYKQALAQHWEDQRRAQDRTAGQRERSTVLKEKLFSINNDPDHEITAAFRQRLYDEGKVPKGSLDGMSMNAMRADPTIRQLVDLEFERRGIPIAAAKAAATSAAGTQADITVKTRPENVAALAKAGAEQASAASKAKQLGTFEGKLETGQIVSVDDMIPELESMGITIPNKRLAQSMLSSARSKDMITAARGYARAREAVRLMDEERMKWWEAAQRGDFTGEENARATYNNHADEYAGAMMDLIEQKSQHTKDEFKAQVPKIGNPIIGLESIYQQIDANAQSGLGIYGMQRVRPDLSAPKLQIGPAAPGGGHAPAPAAKPKAAAPAQAKPFAGGTATKNPDGTYTIRDASGTVRQPRAGAAWVTGTFVPGGGSAR